MGNQPKCWIPRERGVSANLYFDCLSSTCLYSIGFQRFIIIRSLRYCSPEWLIKLYLGKKRFEQKSFKKTISLFTFIGLRLRIENNLNN